MEMRLKTTDVKRTPQLTAQIEEKLFLPLQKLLDKEQSAATVDIELAQITAHHQAGKIWKCEVTITLPRAAHPLRAEVVEETLIKAIDKAKDRIERTMKRLVGKRRTQTRNSARALRHATHSA